ncbi:protealysin inhibitor emfourin [Sodalis sp. C49]|uniref:protealysin inhibitor emfourin n=1 Tax=unclassified Sodalis (in: enterobacteria) TaxID=2636512 RepID=UPI003965D099
MDLLSLLNEHAVIELSREGGFAYIPKLAAQQRFALCDLSSAQREQLCHLVSRVALLAQHSGQNRAPGSGDQRFYRILIVGQPPGEAQPAQAEIVVPESSAPPELEILWQKGTF